MDFIDKTYTYLYDILFEQNYIKFLYIIVPCLIIQILVQVCRNLIRNVHTNEAKWAIEKSLLAKLRKKTGYTFTNCKKALEMHDNDISKVYHIEIS